MSPVEASNILRHELIGLRLRVLRSTNKANVGLRGRVLDETKNMLVVGTPKGPRMVPKSGATFEFKFRSGVSTVTDGQLLVGKPEDRLVKA